MQGTASPWRLDIWQQGQGAAVLIFMGSLPLYPPLPTNVQTYTTSSFLITCSFRLAHVVGLWPDPAHWLDPVLGLVHTSRSGMSGLGPAHGPGSQASNLGMQPPVPRSLVLASSPQPAAPACSLHPWRPRPQVLAHAPRYRIFFPSWDLPKILCYTVYFCVIFGTLLYIRKYGKIEDVHFDWKNKQL